MILGFDNDDETIFDAQREFLREARIAHAMVGMLYGDPQDAAVRPARRRGPARPGRRLAVRHQRHPRADQPRGAARRLRPGDGRALRAGRVLRRGLAPAWATRRSRSRRPARGTGDATRSRAFNGQAWNLARAARLIRAAHAAASTMPVFGAAIGGRSRASCDRIAIRDASLATWSAAHCTTTTTRSRGRWGSIKGRSSTRSESRQL